MAGRGPGRPKFVERELRIGIDNRVGEILDELCRSRGATVSELVRLALYELWQADKDRESARIVNENESERRKYEAIVEMGSMKYGQK